jgi:hypothetical protein
VVAAAVEELTLALEVALVEELEGLEVAEPLQEVQVATQP